MYDDTTENRIYLKLVQKNSFKFPKYFNAQMKYKCNKLIDELVAAKMLAVTDLDLVFDYTANLFLLEDINTRLLDKNLTASEISKLSTRKEKISNLILKEGDRLGLNLKSRSGGRFEKVHERYEYDKIFEEE